MRSKIVEEQLQKVHIADIRNYDPATLTFHIKKYSKPKYEKGRCYLVKVSNELINNTAHVVSVNWNAGRAPNHAYYKIYINAVMGKMIKIDGAAFDYDSNQDLDDMFSGWFDVDYIELIEEL